MIRSRASLACLMTTFALTLAALPARGAVLTGFAAMGASETQGTNFNGSWVPWLVTDRGLNFGPSQSYNRAVGGSTTTTLLSGGQHTQVANLVQNGNVDLAFLFIGGLDVPPVATNILGGTLNVPVWASGVVSRITTAMDTVLAQHPDGMVVAGLPDMRLVPGGLSLATPELTVAIIDAIDVVNAQLKSAALSRGLVYIDVASAMQDLYYGGLTVGGVPINMTVGSSNPRNFFADNIHPGYVGNGYFANLMATALNVGYGQSIPKFTDQAILTRAGLLSGYTGETSNINYAQYIYTAAVPEPSTSVLLFIGGVSAGGIWFRRNRKTLVG
jgi:hypothetical protein